MTERRASQVAVAAILLAGAGLRVWGLGFGLPLAVARPDETTIAGSAVQFLSGSLEPTSFLYPTLFMYGLSVLYLAYYWISRPFTEFVSVAAFAESRRQSVAPFFYISRGASALMGTLTVWWVYKLGRRLFDETVGLVSALVLALSFLHVRDSHFGVTDVTMTAFIVLTVAAILRWQERGDWRGAAIAGLLGGITMSIKYNGLGVWVPFLVAAAQRYARARSDRAAEARRMAASIAIFGAVFATAFFAGSPYVLIRWDRFVADVGEQGRTLAIGHGLVMSRGWLHHATVTLPAALGWPIYLTGAAGLVGLLATRFRQSVVWLSFPVAYYIVAGNGHTVFARYMLPVLPFLSITAAWLIVTSVRAVVPDTRAAWRVAVVTGVALVLLSGTAWKSITSDRLLARADNRVVTARAVIPQLASGSTMYHSGGTWGRLPFFVGGLGVDVHLWGYDEATGRFTPEGADLPDWIVLQRSPLVLYSHVPAGVERTVGEQYELVYSSRASDDRPGRVYDQQDAFFLPLDGLDGVIRPGPNFEVYRRRGR